jgi:hypothetical protein
MKRAKDLVQVKSSIAANYPAPSQLDTALIKEARIVMKDPKYSRTLDNAEFGRMFTNAIKNDITAMYDRMPDSLGDAMSSCLCRALGMARHTSWMRIGINGENILTSAYFKPEHTDEEMQAELDKMKKKLCDDFKEKKGVTYNAAHAAIAHDMMRLPSGALQLLGNVTALLDENSDDDEEKEDVDDAYDSNDDENYKDDAGDDSPSDEEEDDSADEESSDEEDVPEPPVKKQRKGSH